MLPFPLDTLRVYGRDGTFKLVKSHLSAKESTGESLPETTTVTTVDGKEIKYYRHKGSDDFPAAVVPALAIVFTFIWLIVKAVMAPFTQRGRQRGEASARGGGAALSDEEQAVLVKLQRTLADMESRIESLETILIDEHRTKEKYGTKI